ncbi:hypothetical protein [Streptomyces vietnamensis]|uniref:Secreted protein n=1 Tax=Streptomyces vietnamensis TaxID=362257 RepID=A0A0B5IL64_9ACTN|nr:hypothetical protein [Streptomyces vietnamensis]AJF70378.1 hypothetical protein SVTN_40015 [Streptomyces vietnamensis]
MLNTFRRSATRAVAAVAVMTASVSLAAAPSAFASGATSCPRDGYITPGDRCTTLSGGILSIQTSSPGSSVYVNYYRTGSGSLSAKLGYERSGVSGYSSYINMSTTPFHYGKLFTYSNSCAVVYGKLLTSGGALYVTPAADPC